MFVRASLFLGAVALGGVLVGCGNKTCQDVCDEKRDNCPELASNCSESCGDVESFNRISHCEESYGDLAECRLDDACGQPDCGEELAAYRSCRDVYCHLDPSDSLCNTASVE